MLWSLRRFRLPGRSMGRRSHPMRMPQSRCVGGDLDQIGAVAYVKRSSVAVVEGYFAFFLVAGPRRRLSPQSVRTFQPRRDPSNAMCHIVVLPHCRIHCVPTIHKAPSPTRGGIRRRIAEGDSRRAGDHAGSPGLGGVHKARIANPGCGNGKRGGYRYLYLYFQDARCIHLLIFYFTRVLR